MDERLSNTAARAAEPRRRATFMGLDLEADGAVLVPRAETELLARAALAILRAGPRRAPLVVDMCCGAGNLAACLAHAVPAARVFAADLTTGAVEAARRNVRRLGLAGRVTVHRGDLFGALAGLGLEGEVDLVVCNPPYISTARLANESAHLLAAEPREAFDGGPYGIGIHQRLVRDAAPFLRPGGHLAFEFGAGQDRQAEALLKRARAYDTIEVVRDAAGQPRVATARLADGPA